MQAWLFPGQGSQYVGMGRQLLSTYPKAARVYELAEDLSGIPLRQISALGPSQRLMQPEALEPALVALEIAWVEVLRDHGLLPDVVAGYSLGQIPALYCAGVLSMENALRLSILRGQCLQAVADSGDWRMVAISGMDSSRMAQLLEQTIGGGVAEVAGWNAIDHITIAGEATAVNCVEAAAVRSGAAVSQVDVAGPWHTRLAMPASYAFAGAISGVQFLSPSIPLVDCWTGKFITTAEQACRAVAEQMYRVLRWRHAIDRLWRIGVTRSVEVGPGRTLTGLLSRDPARRAWRARFVERANGKPFSFDNLE